MGIDYAVLVRCLAWFGCMGWPALDGMKVLYIRPRKQRTRTHARDPLAGCVILWVSGDMACGELRGARGRFLAACGGVSMASFQFPRCGGSGAAGSLCAACCAIWSAVIVGCAGVSCWASCWPSLASVARRLCWLLLSISWLALVVRVVRSVSPVLLSVSGALAVAGADLLAQRKNCTDEISVQFFFAHASAGNGICRSRMISFSDSKTRSAMNEINGLASPLS